MITPKITRGVLTQLKEYYKPLNEEFYKLSQIKFNWEYDFK